MPARANLIMSVIHSSASPGGTGSFDVVLIDADAPGSATHPVNAFSVELTVPGTSGIKFTAADVNTTAAPYIFGTLQTPPFTFDTFPTTDVTVADFDPPGASTPIGPGQEFGLGHLSYSVAPGTPLGLVAVSFVAAGTSLTDPNGNPIAFSASTDGSISVVPEPSALVLTAIGGAALLGCLRRRRTKASV
jgi:hypothetical protein